jgi:DNA-binding NarL/FixJ family response regulator
MHAASPGDRRVKTMQPRTPISVALSRFEDLVNRGLRVLIDEDPHLLVVAHDLAPEHVPAALAEHEPQVALLNFGSLRSPIEVHELHAAHPGTRLVVLASRPTQSECNQMLTFGATACLSKETQGRDILNAIHLASRGLHLLPRTPSELAPTDIGPELLTPREADVLELLQRGRSNAQIAAELHVGVETVRTHARNIYRKLGVRTRRELASLTPAPR